jgi:Xaa-Pro aminopeptidase
VVVDIGARLDGYHSDLTRTFIVGPGPARDPEFATVYAVVADAHRAAIAGLHAGLTGPQADKLARDVIAGAGYGELFGHGLGHGVGLKVHEAPRLSYAAQESPLAANMVTSIEPGIYLPGRFGVRIEDLVVIRPQAAEVLTRAAHQPLAAAV